MHRLIAEWVIGVPIDDYQSEWMQRGKELEEQAVLAYEFQTSREAEKVGFVTTDDGFTGCSPDRFVGSTRGLELKCPSPAVQVGYLLSKTVDEEYKPQVQGCLYICEREFWDVAAYCPGFPMSIIETGRDDAYIEKLAVALDTFNQYLQEAKSDWTKRFGEFGKAALPALEDHLGVSDADLDLIMERRQHA